MRRTSTGLLLLACLSIPLTSSAVSFPGPDTFGYLGSSLPLNLRDISVSGADIGLDDADDEVATVAIGFTFSFYGVDYTSVEVSSNGFITFSPTGSAQCCSGETIPTAGDPDNFIAAWWEDLDAGEGGIIRAQTLGTPGSREFVVGFYDVRDNDDPANVTNTFEIILHEGTNDVEVQVLTAQFDDVDDKVSGIENADGTDGIEVVFLEASDPGYANGDEVLADEGLCFSSGGTGCQQQQEAAAIPDLGTLGAVLLSLAMAAAAVIALRR